MGEGSNSFTYNIVRAEDTIPGYRDILDDLTKLTADLPPVPVFASSRLFPSDAAWKFQDGGRDYLCAGPAFWAKVPEAVREPQGNPFVLGAVAIIDIDETANRALRAQVLEALLRRFRRAED